MGSWIYTASGRRLDFDRVHEYDFPIEEIAQAISRACRFNGHTANFYSVAEHSVHVSREVQRLGFGPRTALAALLHDGEEAYTGDVVRPLKEYLASSELRALCQRLTHRIWEVHDAIGANVDIVKQVDAAVQAAEWEQVFELQPPPEPEMHDAIGCQVRVEFLTPQHAEIFFLMEYEELREQLERGADA